jgi:hypothetical protein
MGMVSNTPWAAGARGSKQRAWKEHKAILTTMKLSLQEETGMLSAAYKWLRKQLGIQNVDTVASNMGTEIIERWKKA